MATPFKDDDFLCERCGYVLNGLGAKANCPECGKSAYESHPENRVINEWQRKFDFAAIGTSLNNALTHPIQMFGTCQFIKRRGYEWMFGEGLFALPVAIISCTAVISMLFYGYYVDTPIGVLIVSLPLSIIFIAIPGIGILILLVMIEIQGICFFGARHGWRINERNATTICMASMPGWIFGLGFCGVPVTIVRMKIFEIEPNIYTATAAWYNLYEAMQLAPFLFGMLWFETLVYIGMRRMKFANPPEAAPPWSIADALRARGDLKGEQK